MSGRSSCAVVECSSDISRGTMSCCHVTVWDEVAFLSGAGSFASCYFLSFCLLATHKTTCASYTYTHVEPLHEDLLVPGASWRSEITQRSSDAATQVRKLMKTEVLWDVWLWRWVCTSTNLSNRPFLPAIATRIELRDREDEGTTIFRNVAFEKARIFSRVADRSWRPVSVMVFDTLVELYVSRECPWKLLHIN